MSDAPQIERVRRPWGTVEEKIQTLSEDHRFLYRFVENLNREVEKLSGDPFLGTDTIRDERDSLAQWKREQLTVKAWWDEVDAYVRKHPSTVVGESVAAAALRLLRDRDELVRAKRITS